MRKGSGKRRFACEHPGCDKVFNRKDYLERHAVNHLDVKPFNCKHCDRQFSREDLYENHLKSRLHIKRLRPLDAEQRPAPSAKRLKESVVQSSSSYLDPPATIYEPTAVVADPTWLTEAGQSELAPELAPELASVGLHEHAAMIGVVPVAVPVVAAEAVSGPKFDGLDAPLLPLRGSFGGRAGTLTAGDRQNTNGAYDDVFGPSYAQYGMSVSDYALPNYGMGTVEGIGMFNGEDPFGTSGVDPSLDGYASGYGSTANRPFDTSGFLQPPRYKMYANPLDNPMPRHDSHGTISTSDRHSYRSRALKSADSMTSTDATSVPALESTKSYFDLTIAGSGSGSGLGSGSGSGSRSGSASRCGRGISAGAAAAGTILGDAGDTADTGDTGDMGDGSSSTPASSAEAAGVEAARLARSPPRPHANHLPHPHGPHQHGHAHALRKRRPSGTVADSGSNSTSTSGSDEEVAEPPAYKAVSYLLKTKQTSDELLDDAQALDKALREPAPTTPEARDFERKYRWFFDDEFTTSAAKYGYDRCFAQAASTYQQRSKRYRQEHGSRRFPRDIMPREVSARVLQILRDAPEGFLRDPKVLDHYLYVAWTNSAVLPTIVHRPSFDVVETHPALLATMVVLGMAMSPQPTAKEVARSVYPTVYLYTYEAIVKLAVKPESDRFSAASIGPLQAFCLLMRYEQVLLGKGFKKLSLILATDSLVVVNRCIWTMLLSVPQLKIVSPGEKFPSQPRLKPVLATVSQEGYIFHQGADKEQQWLEWVAYETAKRTAQLALFCDCIYSLSLPLGQRRPVSLFNLDIHALCPDSLWDAQSQPEFFFAVGPTLVVNNVPFLGLLKSMIRFPRVASQQARWKPRDLLDTASEQRTATWSRFSLRMIAYGLTNIVGRLSGLFNHGDMILQEVLARPTVSGEPGDLGPPVPTIEKWVSPFFDQRTQARLYRGLDVWFNHFEQAYGDVTQRLFKVAGIFGLKVDDEFGMLDQEDRGQRVPAYAFIVVLYHYSSFIFVHEDLPIVLQVTTNLHTWLAPDETTGQLIGHDQLLEYLYMPLYVQWAAQTDEARAIVSTASLYLVWLDAATGQVPVKMSKYQLFSACVFVSVIVIWLHDLASVYLSSDGDLGSYESEPLSLDNYLFMDDAVLYLHGVFNRLETPEDGVLQRPQGSVRAVILMGACLLHLRPHTQQLVRILTWLLQVMDPRLSEDALQGVLDGAKSFYSNRQSPSGIL